MLIFISGGVRSGKSAFAEKMAVEHSKGSQIHYIATSKQDDTEMVARIEQHRQRRVESEAAWLTWEVPSEIQSIEHRIDKGSVILLDCLTTWLNNELFSGMDNEEYHFPEREQRKVIFASIVNAIFRLQKNRILIIVSNDLFHDILPNDQSTLVYVEMLGKLHQSIVKNAHEAYICEYGLAHPVLRRKCTILAEDP